MSLPIEFQAALPAVQAAADASSDYRALVLFYLPGGPDCHAVMFPTDAAEYASYLATRGYLANANSGTNVLTGQGAALHPSLVKTAANFNAGKLAIVANLAPMVVPLTKTEYQNASPTQLPVNLFSHYDQQNAEFSGLPRVQGSATGLGGRLMDLIDPTYNAGETIPSTISVAGQNLFMDGFNVRQYQVGAGSAGEFSQYINIDTLNFIRSIAETSSGANRLEEAFAAKVQSGNATGHLVNTAIAGIDPPGFPNTGIGQQFKMVARMIAARSSFGHRRDLFFVSLGGFDTHTNELAVLPGLLTQLDDALDAFYQSTKTLGAGGTSLEANVTTYTLGDFGRCLVPNDSGCDHGWGGHYFVIGGSVLGGHIYSKDDAHSSTVTKDVMPNIRFNGPHDAGQGRLLPTISSDELDATLYKWFGLPAGTPMNLVIPGLAQFTTPDLGFMSTAAVATAPAPAPPPSRARLVDDLSSPGINPPSDGGVPWVVELGNPSKAGGTFTRPAGQRAVLSRDARTLLQDQTFNFLYGNGEDYNQFCLRYTNLDNYVTFAVKFPGVVLSEIVVGGANPARLQSADNTLSVGSMQTIRAYFTDPNTIKVDVNGVNVPSLTIDFTPYASTLTSTKVAVFLTELEPQVVTFKGLS